MIFREGKTLPLTVKVGSSVELQGHNEELYGKFGFEVDEVNSETARKAGVQESKGVVVTKVAINSLADKAGIKPGTVIIAVDRIPVINKEEFDKGIKKGLENKKVLLLIKQANMTRFITLKSE